MPRPKRLLQVGIVLCCFASAAFAQFFSSSHFAGTAGGSGYEDGPGADARFNSPFGIAVDRSGNVYVADTINHTIRKIRSDGVVTTLAGFAGVWGVSDGQRGGFALFNMPYGVAVDASGNVYVADTVNQLIRRITAGGVVTTLAGGWGKTGSDDGLGGEARFSSPSGIATDRSGNVYVADTANHAIRKISPSGLTTTLAGSAAEAGSSDGVGSAARFDEPHGVAVDASGNVYVADYNHTIRKISPEGVVTTLAGLAGTSGSSDGIGVVARFRNPSGVAVDGAGNVYVADTFNETIRKIDSGGLVSTLAGLAGSDSGSVDGVREQARFSIPAAIAADAAGNVYVADTFNSTIRAIDRDGKVRTLAGQAAAAGISDGIGSAARFQKPYAVALDAAENVYIADTFNHAIRKITIDGLVTTLAGQAGFSGSNDGFGGSFYFPAGLAVDASGNVYVSDDGNHTIRKISSSGFVSTVAGLAGVSGSADGVGSMARFNEPRGMAIDTAGNVYVADWQNHTIRKITSDGVVATVAGLAGSRGSSDGPSASARFDSPLSVAVDLFGNLYVADSGNHTIRKIGTDGMVSTVAGLAGARGSTDGTTAEARFDTPSGVAIDQSNRIYVADTLNDTIRKIEGSSVRTIVGLARSSGCSDGLTGAARFESPTGIAVRSDGGNIYVADTVNNTVRKVGQVFNAGISDAYSGPAGEQFHFGTYFPSDSEFTWSVIRRPAGSHAELSSTTIRYPTFTPDVADFFVIHLTARQGSRVSTNSITLEVFCCDLGRRRAVGH